MYDESLPLRSMQDQCSSFSRFEGTLDVGVGMAALIAGFFSM